MAVINKHIKKCVIIALAVGFFALCLYVWRFDILTEMGKLLIVEDLVEPADIIFVLTGDVDSRPFHAAKLFQKNYAPKIAIAQVELSPAVEMGIYPSTTEAMIDVMKKQGVEDSNIVVLNMPGGVSSTQDEAAVLLAYVQKNSIQKVIIVTSRFHSRRARFIFKRALKNVPVKLMLSGAPHYKFDETNWWKEEKGFLTYINEYLKLIHDMLFSCQSIG